MKRSNYLVIALISLTLLPLELAWTRIFSAEFFYTFAFMVLSLAVLGLGLGGLLLRLFKGLTRESLLGIYLSLSGLCALLGPIVVFRLGLDFNALFSDWLMIARLAATVLILMSSFIFGGMGLALLFRQNHQDMPRLYMADLLGAGLGVVVIIWGMNYFGTPLAAFLTALPILVAALIVSPGWTRVLPVAIGALVFMLGPSAESRLELARQERAPVIYKHWDAMAKVKVYDYGEGGRGINVDNVANSPVYPFDGKWEDVKPGETEWGINVSYLIGQFDSCVFMSLGSGGGGDVLQALAEGASEVHAVEINDHVNQMMIHGDPDGYLPLSPPEPDSLPDTTATPDSSVIVEGEDSLVSDSAEVDSVEVMAVVDSPAVDEEPRLVTMPELSGYLYHDPRVTVVSEDARAYVKRFENKFDVIYSLSSNTWSALASGAFALAENYLFTTEAFGDYWTALSDSGFMMMEHQVYVPRLVSEVQDALWAAGVAHPEEHFAVYALPQMRRQMILLSKRPLDDSLRYYAFGPLTEEKFQQIHLLYPPANDSVAGGLINRIITNGWEEEADSARVDISPVTDNRPFVAQMGLWRNFGNERLRQVMPYAEFYGFPLSSMVMVTILAIIVVIMLPINLLPYAVSKVKLRAAPWLYFFFIGMAFMAVEVLLMQKYALLIGPSLYSVVTILMTLLLASGLGSRFSKSFSSSFVFMAIVIWLLLDAFAFGQILYAAGAAGMAVRISITVLLIFPLGFFMGMPFPKGALRVGELIDWGFAVNGAASVLGSVTILMIAFAFGFTFALIVAAALYFIAYLLFIGKADWSG